MVVARRNRLRVGEHVLRAHGAAAHEGVLADAAELMDGGEGADGGEVADLDVAGQRGAVGEHGVRSDVTVVRDVRVSHEEVVRVDGGEAAPTHRATIYRDEFSEYIVVTDFQLGSLALILQVLRRAAD